MSREARYSLYALGAVLLVGAITLAFLPVSISDGGVVDCGAPAQQSALVDLYSDCVPALEGRTLWAWIVGLAGLAVLGLAAYLSSVAGKRQAPST